jgi:hypothetical protein
MPRGRPKKAPFSDLDLEFKSTVESMTDDEIRRKVADTNLDLQQLLNARDLDQDFQEKKAAYGEAGAVYRDGQKAAKLKTKFALMVLEGRGKA